MISDFRTHRLDRNQARKLVAEIVARYPQNVRFSKHALKEMKEDSLTTSDILNVIKSPSAKIMDQPELENGSYRYRLQTSNIVVVLAFVSKDTCVIVTAWRK